ncbi:MAG TPA: gas vesicle protein [Burkholderiales bacterium]|nr:gas vesicle protein [Burkholderiales bacterium]
MRGPARRRTQPGVVRRQLESPQQTVLDLLDGVLDQGAMLDGDITIGVAGVDLVYLRLSALLCAADRLLKRRR